MNKEIEDKIKELKAEWEKLEDKSDEFYGKPHPKYGEPSFYDWYDENIAPLMEREREINAQITTLKAEAVEVGDYISISPYTDWYSYKVIKRTAQTLTCQANRATHYTESWQDGEMEMEDNPNGAIITLKWSKKRHWWSYGHYRVALGAREYRDPSF